MALQVDLLKKIDEEKEKETAASSAAASSDNENAESTISVNVKSGSSSSASSTGISSFGEEQEVEEVEPIPEPEEEEKEAPLPPIVKPAQKKAEEAASAATKRPQARGLTSVEKILYAKWFDGDTPTEVETVAQIFRLGEVDPERAQQAYDIYNQLKTSGQFKETYGAGNSDWIAKMNELGIEKTENLSQADLDYLYGYVRENGTVTASGSLSNAKKYGAASVAAYNVNEFLKDYEATQGLLAEQNELFKELSYWVANGYTNDEIKGKINLSKYNGLYAAQEKTKNGQYTPTTSAIPALTSYGIDGMLFAIRNPNDSKNDYFLDAVQGQLGRGVQPTSTPEQIARRTPGDPAWAPYATSGTMHDEAIKFGVTGFDRKWLDDNYARIANSGDQELINAYGRVAEGVERTEKAQQEAAALRKTVDSMIASGMSADRIFTDDLLEEYPTLKAMYEGQQKLKLVDTTSPVDFDLYALRNEAEKAYKDVEGTVPGKDYAQRLETNLGASTPSYEGDAELDKAEEENLTLVQEIMYFTSTPHEQDAAKSSKPNYYRVMASAASGVSAGTGGAKEAYNSAMTAANDYAGAHYLTAVGALAEAQQHLNDLKDAAKPMDDFLEKWFPEQDKGKVAEGLVNGDIATPDDPEFQKEYGEMKRHLGDYQTYLTNLTEAEGAVANEQRIIDNIAAQYEAAEELNTTGAPSQSVMPMLNYISAYTNYNAKQEYASFGDWQYDVEIHDVPWSEANELLGKRKENNQKDLEYLDTAIEYAENHHADEQTLTNMRRTRDVIEADNRSIEYAQLQNADGFEAAVEQFDKEQGITRSLFSNDNVVRNAIIEFTQMTAEGIPDDAYPQASSIAGEELAIKIAAMTENERDTYKYLYATEGEAAASEYFTFIDDYYLTNRAMSYRQMVADEMTKEHPILMNAVSIAGSPMQALGLVEVVESVLTGGEIDPNSEWFTVAKVVGEVRDTSTDMIVEHFGEGTTAAKVATFGYQTIMSVGDSLAAAPVGGAFTMGAVTFANTAMEATENGGEKWDVLLLSGVNALAEVGTEYIPMKGLEDAFKAGGKTGLKNHLADLMKSAASGLTEAPGEALSELISGAADTIIMDELSAYSQNVAQYMQSGMTEEEANRKATQDFWKNVGMAGLQGLASGGVQNTVAYVAGSALKGKPQQARPVMEEQTAAPAVEEAPVFTEETAVVQEEAPEPGGGLLAEAMAEQNAVPEITPEPDKAKNTRMVNALATAQQDGVSLSDRTATVNGVLEAGGLEPGLALAYAKEIAKDIPGLQQLQQSIQKMTTGDTATALKAAAYRMFAPPANADTMSDADVVSAVESDPKLSGAVENAVLNSDIATETMNVLKAMDKKSVENARKAQQNARRAMIEAATAASAKSAAAGNAFRALQSANEARKQNPTDTKVLNRAIEAAKQMQQAKAEADEARRRQEAAKQSFDEANKALFKENMRASNEARRIAKETVMQRRAEQMEMERQQKAQEQESVADAMYGTSDEARAENLSGKSIAVVEAPAESETLTATDVAMLEQSTKKDAIKYVKALVGKFGIFKKYMNAQADIDFEFTKRGLTESINKQANRSGDMGAFAKMLANIDQLIGNAIPIETHKDKYVGTKREDMTLERVYVLLSAFKENNGVVPVQFEVKEFSNKDNKLYTAVTLKKTEAVGLSADPSVDFDVSNATTASEISVPELIQKINPSDGDFLKYIPDSMLTPEQAASKAKALERENSRLEGMRREYQEEQAARKQSSFADDAPTLTMNPQTSAPAAPVAPVTAKNIPAPPPGTGIRQFVGQTAPNSPVVSNQALKNLRGSEYYVKTSEKENVDKAIDAVNRDGYEARKNKILDGTTNLATPEGQAELVVLAEVARDLGDADGESAIHIRSAESSTTLAQAMAMRKLYLRMTPEGKFKYVGRIVDALNSTFEAKGSDRRIAVPEGLAEQLAAANGNEQETNRVLDEAYRQIASQMPVSIGEMFDTWRYVSMLGNVMTHAKNVLANMAQVPYVVVKNQMAALGETVVQWRKQKSGETYERTKTLGVVKKEYLDLAKEVFKQYESRLRGGPQTAAEKINDWRKKSWAVIDKLARANSKVMAAEDMFFKKRYFQNALAGYLQANNVDASNPDAELMSRATQYAYEQALKNTFNNANAFAEWLSTAQKDAKRRGGAMKLADVAIGANMPFKNTPANVIARGAEYSPIGLINSLTLNTAKLVRGKDFSGKPYTVNQWVDSVSAGLTGTLATGLGALLASIGVLELGDDEDDKLRGQQKNSVNILGFNLSIDSFGSAAMPLLIGAEIYEKFTEEQPAYLEDGFQLKDTPEMFSQLLSTLGTVADPVMELSVMQGMKTLLETAAYSDNSIFGLAEATAYSFVSQFVPSIVGAFARLADPTRRTVYIDKNSSLDSQTQRFLQNIQNKIPGLSYNGAAYLDVWGNEVSNGDFVTRLLSNFLIPGYPKKQQDPDEVTQRLLQLFDDTGMEGFLPSEANKYFTVDGERYNLSAEEYQKYSKTRGDIAHEALESLLANEEFNTAGDVPMVTAVNRVWSYASQMAAYSVNDGYKVESGVLNADNPVEYALEGMRDKAKAEQQAEYELGLVYAIAAGDIQSATACVAGLKQTGRKNNTIKNKVANAYRMKYKTMYEEGDIDGMTDLERDLYSLGIGFTVSDFENWLN